MRKILRSSILAMALCIAFIAPAGAVSCPPFSEEIVISKLTIAEAAIKAFQELLMRALSSQLEQFSKLEITAMKVVAAQVSTAAKAQINANIALKQGEMAALGSLETTKRMAEIVANYSPATGQGTDPCAQLSAQSRLAIAGGQTAAIAEEMLKSTDAGPGKYGNPESYPRKTAATHASFLTPDEEKLGFGKSSNVKIRGVDGREVAAAGLDSNASVLFLDSADPKAQLAKQAFLTAIAGAPDLPIDKELANREEGRQYLADKQRRDALMSIGLNSIATVAAENTPNKELGISEIEAMRRVVSMYYGSSPEARQRWQAWTGQSQRGLMVDGLKMDAVQLMMLQKMYQQGQRMESNLGALVAIEAGRDYKALARTASSLQSNKIPIR